MTSNIWDTAFDCLESGERRAILLTLYNRISERGIYEEDDSAAVTDGGRFALDLTDLDTELDQVRMHHVHLPKMAAAGYIEHSPDGTSVSPGAAFNEIEPLLKVLSENSEELPGIAG